MGLSWPWRTKKLNARLIDPTLLQTVYGSLMQHRAEHVALADAMHAKPYLAPPRAPVLYIKPSNTFRAHGAQMQLPEGGVQLRARACMGFIFKQNRPLAVINLAQCAIDLIVDGVHDTALDIALFADFSLSYDSLYRPPVKFNCMDGSLGLAQQSQALKSWDAVADREIQTWVNGELQHRYSSADWLSSAREQLQAVNEFIAFEAGDVLMMGCPPDAPLVNAGDVVEVRCEGLGSTRTTLVEAA
jgi:5-oxopent-3-ene-1,2,5-tricarboxylate decarboxylase / 2-hydroxyhepta-2,4-diene-1,7-dioate isomerase